MTKSKRTIQDDEINLVDLIRQLFEEKVLILFISIIFVLLATLYGYSKNKDLEFKIQVTLKFEPLFEEYKQIQKSDFDKQFSNIRNFEIFIEQNKEIEDFKKFLKLKNLSAVDYFSAEKFNILPNNNNKSLVDSDFLLIYPKELDGVSFIINYIEFIKKNKKSLYNKKIKEFYQKKINEHLLALEISKKLKIEMPMQSVGDNLSFKGTIYLSEQVNHFRKIYSGIDNEKYFNIDYLISKPVTIGNKSLSVYFVIGLILGLFLSFLIVFVKKSLILNRNV
jgi:hypothetical protein